MKNLIAKLKSADYKQVAINHGEKLVAGLLGLMLLFALLTTSWSTYKKTPEQLTADVDGAKQAIAGKTWADSEDAQKGLYSVATGLKQDQVLQLLTRDLELRAKRVDEEKIKYYYPTPLLESSIRSSEPSSQPELHTVEALIATAGRALIEKNPTTQGVLPNEESGPAEAPSGRRTLKGAGGDIGGPGAGYPGATAGVPMNSGSTLGMGPGMNPGMGPGMGGGMGGGGTDADAVRGVAVRGIVPLLRQIERVKDALHLTHREAMAMVDYWDFHLERRSKPVGAKDAWDEWAPVDIRAAKEMLRDSAGWDPPLIELSLTDPVLTMSLPSRVVYNWMKEEVSHPKLDNYVLSPSQRDRQMEIYEKIIERQMEDAGALKEQQKKGFSDLQGGSRDFGMGMGMGMGMGGGGSMRSQPAQNMIGDIANSMDRDNPEQAKQEIVAQIMRNQTAAGRLLLFRYFDFDVKPGTSYQYRVQLVMANPNFNAPQQSVINPEITKERFLTTPFSQPTAAVSVPNDVNYYVTRVENAKGSNQPSATFDVFQWSNEYGTTINKRLKILFGAFVGSRTGADVVDPAAGQFLEDHEVDFKSEDVLVDISVKPNSINPNDHPDLKLPKDKLRTGLGVAEQALLVNAAGKLVAFDPVSMLGSYRVTKKDYEDEQEDFDSIKQDGAGAGPGEPGSDLTGIGAMYQQGAAASAQKTKKGRSSKRGGNSLRRQGGGYPGM